MLWHPTVVQTICILDSFSCLFAWPLAPRPSTNILNDPHNFLLHIASDMIQGLALNFVA